MAGDRRVAVVVRPLDRLLTLLRFGFVPLLACLPALPTLRAVFGSAPEGSESWLLLAGALVVVVVYIALLQVHGVATRVDRQLARTKRRVALACDHDHEAPPDDARVACLLTPEVLRAPVFRYEQQHNAVMALRQACARAEGEYWVVEGASGSGKTRTALRFVQALIRDRKLFELGDRCYLYDFADSAERQTELLRMLRSPRRDEAVILIDNFQLVRAEVLRALSGRLVNPAGDLPARLVVLLARPGDAWSLNPGSDVRLVAEAKAAGRHIELRGPASDAISRTVSEIDAAAARLVADLEDHPIASAAQLHIAQVIVRNRAAPPDVLAALRLLEGRADATTPAALIRVIAIVTALSMHRGRFSPRDFRRAVAAVTREGQPLRRLPDALRLRLTFRRLRKVGFIPTIHQAETQYIFHEAIAELCVDRLVAVPEFERAFTAVGRARLRELRGRHDALQVWLTAVEIGAQELLEATFDDAVSHGAYERMTRCLRRAADRYELALRTRLQLAILLNRTGQFKAARAEFTSELVEALGESEELGTMLATSRMEATHDVAAEAGLDVLSKHPERFVAVVGQYWKVHMAGHRGRFDPQQLLELATEALAQVGRRPSYWRTYSVARMHFDSLRHLYLAGGAPAAAVASRERRELDRYLEDRLATFRALHLLYHRAHLVGHTLLPKLALFGEEVTADDAAVAGVDFDQAKTVAGLTNAALSLYREAAEEFSHYGDREARYLQADILNAEMIQEEPDVDRVTRGLQAYSAFVGGSDFRYINSYPRFYSLRWHMLSYYGVLLDPLASNLRVADDHLAAAERDLQAIADLDAAAGNEYGVERAKVLDVLLRAAGGDVEEAELSDREREATARGYGFEARLLRRLIDAGPPTQAELRAIFRFYPFVHQ